MGATQKRCPKCKKKRRWVSDNLIREDDAPINSRQQKKHDSGWRRIDSILVCLYCVQRKIQNDKQENCN